MKAITLHQPYASLVALGLKPHETRSWATKHRGPVAIHAAKAWSQRLADIASFSLAVHPDISEAFRKHGLGWGLIARDGCTFPLGAVVAVAEVVDCVRVEAVRDALTPAERATGDYADGRFAWVLAGVRRLPQPVYVQGKQGLWTLPPDVLDGVQHHNSATMPDPNA